jgi:glycerophosphoryl diester phosphodiesterase
MVRYGRCNLNRLVAFLITVLACCDALAGEIVSPRADERPLSLVAGMAAGALRTELAACAEKPVRRTQFSIGHRGAPLRFPEHTRESYLAAAAMGAGVIECDVTFTRDKQLVCRHSQDDLHTTTNILLTPLAARCSKPFRPARFDAKGSLIAAATAECRTSDITLAEFRTLHGKRDGFDPRALTVEQYVAGGTEPLRPGQDGAATGTLMTHAESIALFRQLGVRMVPELKRPVVPMPFEGMSQQDYAQRLVDEYRAAGVPPGDVWLQSFELQDILYWIGHEPGYGKQAVYLDGAESPRQLPDAAALARLHAQGVRIWAPPLFALLSLDERGEIAPSASALAARAAGLELITWTVERSGKLGPGGNGFYYQTIDPAIRQEGDVFRVLDVLARQVGVRGVFSDWPGTVTFYANCLGLE